MKSFYTSWTVSGGRDKATGNSLAQVWVGRRHSLGGELSHFYAIELVRPISGLLPVRSDEMCLWEGYAKRTARAWNALMVAGELLDLRADISPVRLAEESIQAGYPTLAQLMIDAFGLRGLIEKPATVG